MVKKFKSIKAENKTTDGQFAAAVKDSAQQIWLAGLGAFAKAQEEGGKVFEALVKEGTGIQKRTKKMAEASVGEVTGKVTKVAGEISKQATEGWDKLEQVFEDRVARALNRLGVPTSKEIQALMDRVEELSSNVSGLSSKPVRKARAVAAASAKEATASVRKARKAVVADAQAIVASARKSAKAIAKAAEGNAPKVARKSKAAAKSASKAVAKVARKSAAKKPAGSATEA